MKTRNKRVRCCQNWKMSFLKNIHKSHFIFWSTWHERQSWKSNVYSSYAFHRWLSTFIHLKNVYGKNAIDHNTPNQHHCILAATLWRLIYYAIACQTCQTHAKKQYADLGWNIKAEKSYQIKNQNTGEGI